MGFSKAPSMSNLANLHNEDYDRLLTEALERFAAETAPQGEGASLLRVNTAPCVGENSELCDMDAPHTSVPVPAAAALGNLGRRHTHMPSASTASAGFGRVASLHQLMSFMSEIESPIAGQDGTFDAEWDEDAHVFGVKDDDTRDSGYGSAPRTCTRHSVRMSSITHHPLYTGYQGPAADHMEEDTFLDSLLPHGSASAAAFNLASSTLGAGTLAIPAAMALSGVATGSFMLALCAAATIYSVRILVMTVERTGLGTYEAMSRFLVGPWFERVTAGVVILFCWGVNIVYIVALTDILQSLRHLPGFESVYAITGGRHGMVALYWLFFMLPLSLAKEINSLRYASLIGTLSSAVLVLAIIGHSLGNGDPRRLERTPTWSGIAVGIPTFSFAFTCQTNCFEVYAELKERTVANMTRLTAISMGLCCAVYIAVGIAGYADFGSHTSSNVLANYGDPTRVPYICTAVLAITFTITMAFPICIFPTRDAVLQLLGYHDTYATPERVRIVVSVLLALSSLIAGELIPNLGVLFGVIGGVCSTCLAYVWPALFAFKAGGWTPQEVGWANVIATVVLGVGGAILGVLGTVTSVRAAINGGV